MNILGLSGGLTHDAAACIVIDGQVVAMEEEERFIRRKHALRQPPVNSAAWCLNKARLTLSDVDLIACSWNPDLDQTDIFMKTLMDDFFQHDVFSQSSHPPVEYMDHHLCHAAASYFFSGLESAAFLVADGSGEISSTSIGLVRNGEFTFLKSFPISDSLGHFYRRVTRHLGLGHAAEGKLMGLAAYGTPIIDFPITLSDDGYEIDIIPRFEAIPPLKRYNLIRESWEAWLVKNCGPAVLPRHSWTMNSSVLVAEPELTETHNCLATSAQRNLERVILHLVGLTVKLTGIRDLVFAGGIALNCGVNSAIQRSGEVNRLFVFPAANDAGGAFGAAMLAAHRMGDHPKVIRDVYLGRAFMQHNINNLLKGLGYAFKTYPKHELIKYAAQAIAQQRVVGWFQGETECGPRALGHRSILASPARKMWDHINSKIKYRESWRPLAPSIPIEYAGNYFLNPYPSPFMLHFFDATPVALDEIPAVIHVDGTSRPQFVAPKDDPVFHELLLAVGELTGVPAVINTSLNTRGDPIVDSPIDALQVLASTSLDLLILGNAVIEKRNNAS